MLKRMLKLKKLHEPPWGRRNELKELRTHVFAGEHKGTVVKAPLQSLHYAETTYEGIEQKPINRLENG